MPIQIQAPDGSIAEFPDGTPDAVIEGVMKQEYGGPQQASAEPVGYGEDMAKGFGAGVAQGAIGLPGGVGSANDINQGLIKGAADYVGAPEWLSSGISKGARYLMPFGNLPNTQQLTDMVESGTGPLDEAKTVPGQYAQTMGQFAPGMALGPGSVGGRVASGVASALGSETAGQVTKGTAVEPYARLGGALIGGAIPDVTRRAVTPFPVNAERQKQIGLLGDEGVELTAGQKTGSKPLQYLESELGGGKAADVMERQGEQFTSAAASKAGIKATRLTADVMDDAFEKIGSQFDDLAARTPVPMDAKLQDDMLSVVTDYQSVAGAPASAAEEIMNRVSELAGKNGGVLTGEAYKNINSLISRKIRTASDPDLKTAIVGLKASLDDAVERGLSGDLLGEWKAVRNNYRNLIVLEKSMTGAGEKVAEGILSPQQLRSATVQKHGGRNYVRGKGDYAKLARSGEAVMKPLPNSGTAGRLNAQNLGMSMTTLLGAAAGSGAGAQGALLGGLLGMGVPFAAGRALMSKPVQAYLSNQLFPGKGVPLPQKAIVPLLGVSPSLTGPR